MIEPKNHDHSFFALRAEWIVEKKGLATNPSRTRDSSVRRRTLYPIAHSDYSQCDSTIGILISSFIKNDFLISFLVFTSFHSFRSYLIILNHIQISTSVRIISNCALFLAKKRGKKGRKTRDAIWRKVAFQVLFFKIVQQNEFFFFFRTFFIYRRVIVFWTLVYSYFFVSYFLDFLNAYHV